MIGLEQLQSIGLAPEAARRALQALRAGDIRGFVHELLIHGLWGDVADETQPMPQWIERWRQLASTDFPIIDMAAMQRLLDAGVDVHDLTGVVRSAQILAIYNIAQLLDYPALGLGWNLPESATPHLACGTQAAPETQRLQALAPELLMRDPSGRHGEPQPLALRQWRSLPDEPREHIRTLVLGGQRARAAAVWKQRLGGDLSTCLAAVDILKKFI